MINSATARDLCIWWDRIGKDPVDQMRRRKRQDEYALRYALRARQGHEAHELSNAAQDELIKLLQWQGLAAYTTTHKAAFDLLIEDSTGRVIKAELKSANWTQRSSQSGGHYKAKLPKRQRAAADLVIFGCKNGHNWHWFIIPTRAIQAKSLEITRQDPHDYRGKYRQFLEAWPVLHGYLQRAEPRPRQMELQEAN